MSYYTGVPNAPRRWLLNLWHLLREFLNVRVLGVFMVGSLLLGAVGWHSYDVVRQSVRSQVANWLGTMLDADVQKISVWFELEKSAVVRLAGDSEVERLVRELVSLEGRGSASRKTLLTAKALPELRDALKSYQEEQDLSDFVVTALSGRNIAAWRDDAIGTIMPKRMYRFMEAIAAGKTVIAREAADEQPQSAPVIPGFLIGALVRDDEGAPAAVLSFKIRPNLSFPGILASNKGAPGVETLAFEDTGVIISGAEAGLRFSEFSSGLLVETHLPVFGEFPNAQGRRVAGMWTWLSDYHIGLVTEMDATYAYSALKTLQRAFALLFGLLVLSALGVMLVSYALLVWRRAAKKALLEARQLGQYVLEERVGKGGMGEVYRARHRLLRRPTAIKLIHSDSVPEKVLAQFEREVQLTSRLTHPNTIAIYDYGRTPDNIFYYAMEYLTGITLKQLVADYGPQREARVIHILQGICASLEEAHEIGLIHRDIKPANVMLCYLGGMCDVVKVLDFGLVTDISDGRPAEEQSFILGSLRFMAPEVIMEPHNIDARSDIYALGALAYFVLTGEYVFQSSSDVEYQAALVSREPVSPSERCGRQVSKDLESLILACLQRDPQLRPQDVKNISRVLAGLTQVGKWRVAEAAEWWLEFGKRYKFGKFVDAVAEIAAEASLTVDLAERK